MFSEAAGDHVEGPLEDGLLGLFGEIRQRSVKDQPGKPEHRGAGRELGQPRAIVRGVLVPASMRLLGERAWCAPADCVASTPGSASLNREPPQEIPANPNQLART
jgi:hypothetical protein